MLNSIKQRIFFSQVVSLLLLLLAVSSASFFLMKWHLEKVYQTTLQITAENTAAQLGIIISDKKRLMQRIADHNEFREYHEKFRSPPLLKAFAIYGKEFSTLSYITAEGLEDVKIVAGIRDENYEDYSENKFLVKSVSEPDKVIIAVQEWDGRRTIEMFLTKKQYFGDVILGTLYGEIPLRYFESHLAEIKVGEAGFALITDSSGHILAVPSGAGPAQPAGGANVSHRALISQGSESRDLQRAQVLGIDGFIAYAPVPDMDWKMIIFYPYVEFIATPNRLVGNIALIVLIISSVVIVMSFRRANSIAGPIKELSSATSVISRGNYEVKIETYTNDEIGELAQSFNRMADTLQQTVVSKDYVNNIITSMQDMLIVTDPDGNIKTVNKAACTLLGYRENELIAAPFTKIFADIEQSHEISIDKFMLRKLVEKNNNFHTKDGRHIPVLISASMMRDHENNVKGFVCAAQDITEIREAEDKLRRFAAELEKSNKELHKFLEISSHDLQEPLRKITTFGSRLAALYRSKFDEKGRHYLDRIESSAKEMSELIEALRAFSSVTEREQEFSAIDLNRTVDNVVSELKPLIDQTRGRVETDSLEVINADPVQTQEMLRRLIKNALKFRKQNEPPVVRISGVIVHGNGNGQNNEDNAGSVYKLTIEDNGIGFDEKYSDRIFEVFSRLHSKRKYAGTGIGLSICKKIAERHGGTIEAKSTSGQGAKFIVSLPVRQSNGEGAEDV